MPLDSRSPSTPRPAWPRWPSKRGWLIEYWSKAARGTDRVCPSAPCPPPRTSRKEHSITWPKTPRPNPRPGFVLDVDRQTPPILFHHGEGFRMEKLPVGPQPGDLSERAAPRHRKTPTAPSVEALLHPIDDDPLPASADAGHEAHDRLRRHLPAPAPHGNGPTFASASSKRCSTWPPRPASTTSTSSLPSPCIDA